jgi:Uma2 family endonuclease
VTSLARPVQAPPTFKRWRWTLAEYLRLGETGIIGEDERVELIDGEIVCMAPIGDRHYPGTARAMTPFARRVPDACIVSVQGPLRLGQGYEPMPDVVVLKPCADFYVHGHKPDDVLLVIEVADSSRDYDLNEKARLYAAALIPEYWVADLVEDTLVVHRQPTTNGYGSVQSLKRGQMLAPLAFPDWELAVEALLP